MTKHKKFPLLSLCAFSDALTFKEIDSADIQAVENFVKFELELIVSFTPKLQIDGDEPSAFFIVEDRVHFYGEFVSSSEAFHFSIVEVKMIEFLVTHVKCVVESGNACHFTKDNSSEDQLNGFHKIGKYFGDSLQNVSREPAASKTHFFLRKLLATADQNALREKHGYRYDDLIKQFATYIRMISGPLAYETFQKNLECALPTLQSINRYIRSTNCKIIEGVLRCDELRLYLEERNLPLVVSLSEDATRIEGRVQYDSKTNQLIGFVLPINQQTGMPVPNSFKARNAPEIFEHFASNEQSHFVNVIMAQPLAKVAPFCLLIFGSNAKYTTEDVSKRWSFIVDRLQELSIKVLTISSDSDPKYNSAMRKDSQLGLATEPTGEPTERSSFIDWFCCGNFESILKEPFFVQDTPHVGTKLRNCILKTKSQSKKLPFGKKYFIDMQHLDYLLTHFSKADHTLCATTLNPIDRQNFSSVLRMCSKEVTSLLRRHVKNSEGTAMFLDIMRNLIDVFMKVEMTPLERVRKMWFSVFVIRIWRDYISSKKKLTLKENFISLNCYVCIELNAHSLVKLMIYLRDNNMSKFFVPNLFNSQQCESMFRLVRSFTTTYSTVVNCSVKEILERISKIQLQTDIATHNAENFAFPRVAIPSNEVPMIKIELPSPQEIYDEIEKCKEAAINYAKQVGLVDLRKSKDVDISCKLAPYVPHRKKQTKKTNDFTTDMECFYERLPFLLPSGTIKNYSDKFLNESVPETCPFVEVNREIINKKKRLIVKKTFVCWLLRSNIGKLSSDRLERVKSKINRKKAKPHSEKTNHRQNFNVKPYQNLTKY